MSTAIDPNFVREQITRLVNMLAFMSLFQLDLFNMAVKFRWKKKMQDMGRLHIVLDRHGIYIRQLTKKTHCFRSLPHSSSQNLHVGWLMGTLL